MLFNRKKIIMNLQLFFCFVFVGCNDANNEYYVINKVRVVAAVFQNSGLVSGGNTLTDTLTQQFPLRTGCSGTRFYLLVVSPTAETPTVTLNSIKGFPIGNNYLSGGGGARGVSPGQGAAAILSNFFTSPTTPTVTSIQTTPFRLTVFEYPVNCGHLTSAQLNTYLSAAKDIPGFQLSYTASSSISSDNGFYSFYFLPQELDGWWSTPTPTTSVPASKLTQIKNGLAITKVSTDFIQISSVIPTSPATIPADGETSIIANLATQTIPAGRANNLLFIPKTRLQWYMSSGELELDTANSTKWNPKSQPGQSVGGFVVVRDLLGGIDFKLLGPFTTQ